MAVSPWIFDNPDRLGVWTGSGYDYSAPRSFGADALTSWMAQPNYAGYYSGDSGPPPMTAGTEMWGLNYGGQGWTPGGDNYMLQYDPATNPNSLALQIKSGDKQGTTIPYVKGADGNWTLDPNAIRQNYWDTNQNDKAWGYAMPIVAGLGAYGIAGALGATGGAAAPAAAGAPTAASTAPAGIAETMWPGLSQTMPTYASQLSGASGLTGGTSGGVLGGGFIGAPELLAAGASAAGGAAPAATTTPAAAGSGSVYTQIEQALGLPAGTLGKAGGAIGAAGSMLGGGTGGSNSGSLLGAGLGGLLGYLDAKNQPDSLTIKKEIDPRLAAFAYGADGSSGLAGAANTLMQQQLGAPNPLTQAGEKISGMPALPGWGSLVDQSKSQWDANPWIGQQQKAITDLVTRNLKENVFSDIGDQANFASGYGGTKNAQALGLAASRMNTDLGKSLADLASGAWESSQNRALAGAQGAANYGLSSQQQQANLWNTGANLQAQGAWNPITNMSNVLRSLPGNSSETQPLFSNPWLGALGGAQTGSQVAGSVDWEKLLGGIGGILGWFGNGTKQG